MLLGTNVFKFPDLLDFYDSREFRRLQNYVGNQLDYLVTTETDHYLVEVALAGHNKETVSVSVNEGRLSIKANSEGLSQLSKSLNLSLTLPKDCDQESASAKMTDGLLRIEFKRKQANKLEISVS